MFVRYWSTCLAVLRANIKRNISLFGDNPCDLHRKSKPATYLMNRNESLVCRLYRECLAKDNNVPAITSHNVSSRSVKCEGEFDVLAWMSHIPSHKCYIVACTIEKSPDHEL